VQYIYSLITLAFQSLGQIFTLLLGWVIAAHFGRVPTRQKYILSAMGGISLVWAAMALSLSFPWIRNILSRFNDQAVPFYIKLIIPLAGIGWISLPLINGFLAVYLKRLTKQEVEPTSFLLGYKYTPGFALALILTFLSLPLVLLPPLLKGLRREHVMIMINPGDFDNVLQSIIHALSQKGIGAKLQPGTLWQRSPLAILALFAHDLLGDWTKSRARLIVGQGFQIIVHPTDLVIEGEATLVVKVRNMLVKKLTFFEAYFTWDGEAHKVEERINLVRRKMLSDEQPNLILNELGQLEDELDRIMIPLDEWGNLNRQILQLKVNCLNGHKPHI